MESFKHRHAKHVYRQWRQIPDGSFILGDLVIIPTVTRDDAAMEDLAIAAHAYAKRKGISVIFAGEE